MEDVNFDIDFDTEFIADVEAARKAFVDFGGTIDDFESNLKGLQKANIDKLFKSFVKVAPGKQQAKEAVDWTGAMKEGGLELLGLGSLAGGVGAAFVLGAQQIKAFADSAISAVSGVVTTLAQGVVSGAEFGRTTLAALTRFSGGDSKKAKEQLAAINDIAAKTGGTLQESAAAFVAIGNKAEDALGSGFRKDLAALKLTADELNKAGAGVGNIAEDLASLATTKGAKPTVDQFERLQKISGQSKGDLLKRLGFSDAEAQRAVKDSKFLADQLSRTDSKNFVQASLEALKATRALESGIRDQRSPFENFKTLVQTQFSKAFEGVDFNAVLKSVTPLIAQFGDAIAQLGPYVETAVKAGADFIAWLQGSDEKAVKFREAVAGLVTALSPISDALKGAFAGTTFDDFIDGVTLATRALGFLVNYAATQVAGIITVFRGLASIQATMVELGGQIVDGLIQGLQGAISRLVSTVRGMADSVKNTFSGALDIRSPSKVFEGLGGHITEGAARGIEAGAPRIESATVGAAGAPLAALGLPDASTTASLPPAPSRSASGPAIAGSGGPSFTFGDVYADGLTADTLAAIFADTLLQLGGELP